MPTMSWRNWVGVAADRINGVLTTATAVGAVTIPLTTTVGTTGTISTSGATYTAFFLDGPNSEATACSGNFTTTIACAATANAHPAGTYVYFQLTASIGPTQYLPVENPQLVDIYDQLPDLSNRGSAVVTNGMVQGTRQATFALTGAVFPDSFGYLLGGLFGAEDYSAGTPSKHKFSVTNAASGLTPPGIAFEPVAYILYQYNGVNQRSTSGRFSEVAVTLDPKALMKYSAKFIGRASGVNATTATTAFTAVQPLPVWEGFATIGGAVTFKVQSFDITMTRDSSEMIPVLQGNQDPATAMVGPMKATGKVVLYKDDDTFLNDYINNTQPAFLLTSTFGTGATQTALNFQMTKCNFSTAQVKVEGKSYVTEEIGYEGIANTTDATTAGGGTTPVQVNLWNAISSGTTYT